MVAANELGGRFLKVTEHHRGDWDFYLLLLAKAAEPCAALAALGLFPLLGHDARRRSLVLASGLAAAALLAVLSTSRSKMEWYATPMVPLLSVTAALGLADALRWLQARWPRWAGAGRAAAAVLLAGGALCALDVSQTASGPTAGEFGGAHLRYGEFLERLRSQQARLRLGPTLTVLDGGFYNDAGFAHYDPMLKFYAERSARRGLAIRVVDDVSGLAQGEAIASCDPEALSALRTSRRLTPLLTERGCVLATLGAGPPR